MDGQHPQEPTELEGTGNRKRARSVNEQGDNKDQQRHVNGQNDLTTWSQAELTCVADIYILKLSITINWRRLMRGPAFRHEPGVLVQVHKNAALPIGGQTSCVRV
jgi:hypothetical protein